MLESTNSTHDGLGGAGANKSKAHTAHELVRTQNQAVLKIVKTAELTYSRLCIQADQAPSDPRAVARRVHNQSLINATDDDLLHVHALPSVRVFVATIAIHSGEAASRSRRQRGVGLWHQWHLSISHVAPNT